MPVNSVKFVTQAKRKKFLPAVRLLLSDASRAAKVQAKVEQKFRNNLKIPKKHITFVATFGNERGEMAEWSIAAVLKTVEPRGSGGSNPSLSAINIGNQWLTRLTPDFTPKNVKSGVFIFI